MCCVGARLCEQALRLSVCVCGCVWCGVCVCRCVCVVWCVWYGVVCGMVCICVCVCVCGMVCVCVCGGVGLMTVSLACLNSTQDESGHKLSDRDLAMGWALATFFRQVGINKSSSSGILERVQSFIMKDKRGFKIPGSRSAKAKVVVVARVKVQRLC